MEVELAWKPEDSDYCNIICFTVATRHLDIKPSDLHEEDSHNRLAHTLYLVCTQRIFTKGVSRIFCSTKQKFCHGEKTEARIKSSDCFFIFFSSSSRSKMVSYLPLMKFWCQKWSVIFLSYTAWENYIEMHISRREIEKREIGDREISREKWGIEKSGKNREEMAIISRKKRKKPIFSW